VNTCPENFLWEKDKTILLTVAPGLYELNLGMFSRKRPNAHVQVNGENILAITGVKVKAKTLSHSAGSLTGHTLQEFIALPSRARISVLYSGEPNSEGFISLRKL
jgi:hypothetical protein